MPPSILSAWACPSDPTVINGNNANTTYAIGLTSYRGINGPFYSPSRYLGRDGATAAQYQQMASQGMGVIYHGSSNGIDSITDGTSNTMLLGEYVYGRLDITDQNCWHWWTAGNADTIGTAMYAPNVAWNGNPDTASNQEIGQRHEGRPGDRLAVEQSPWRGQPLVRGRVGQVHQEHHSIVDAGP